MADKIEEEFISGFRSLTGITIKERYKNFFDILNKTQYSLQLSSGKINLSSLVPTNPLEENFKVTALIYFKCADELLNVLKSENPVLIDRVLKNFSWIIKQVFIDLTPDYLATQLFPNISYITKLKLLNRLSLHLNDSYTADTYFIAIKKHYGFYLASKLLAACSSDLIIKSIEHYKVEITPKQLLLIIKRYPTLIEIIFEKLEQQNTAVAIGIKYKTVFKYLSANDVEVFIKLYEKYSPNTYLGQKETDSFIKNLIKLNAVNSLAKFNKILKTKQVWKSMGTYFSDFYFAIFPKRISLLKHNSNYSLKFLHYLSNVPQKLKVFSNTFQKIYGNEIWKHPEFMHEMLIKWMSPDERTVWMENHSRPCNISEETWISYYKCDKSIPLLKEKIRSTFDVNSRGKWILALLNTCKLNRDELALLDVLKYVNLRHRNDHKNVEKFLFWFKLYYKANQLTEKHWIEIYQSVQVYVLNTGYYYFIQELLERCICYNLCHNLPVTNILEFMVKYNAGEFNICESHPKFEKHCLKEFESLVFLGYKNEELNKGYVKYLYCVNNYNLKYPRNKLIINIRTEYIEYIRSILQKENDHLAARGAVSVLILQDCIRAEREGLLELFFKQHFYCLQSVAVIEWLIKENPLLFMKYFKHILSSNSYHHIIIPRIIRKFCTKYAHLNIPQNINKLCLSVVNDTHENDTNKIRTAIIILSILTTPQEFIQFSSTYYPTESAPNLNSDINRTLYIKQQTIAGHLKNSIPVSQALVGILNFCIGDYLKFTQKSLESASVNVAENKLLPFFTTLIQRAVSVRKHAIFLSPRVLNKYQANHLLLELKQKEKNPSLHKVLFKTIFYNFLNNPDDYSWDFTKQIITTLDASDDEAFEILTTCCHVPICYFSKYLEFSWDIIQKCSSSNKTVENGQLGLLNLATPANITTLTNVFCKAIIEQNLFKCKQLSDLQKGIQSFACRYLVYGPGTDEERLQAIFSQIINLQSTNWNNVTTAVKLKLLNNFVKQFCSLIIDNKCIGKTIFRKFLNQWENTYQPSEAFDEFVYLQLTSVYLDALCKKFNIFQVGESVSSICELLHKEKSLAVKPFLECLITFLSLFYSLEFIGESDENEMTLIEGIVNNRVSCEYLELAIYLLPNIIPVEPTIKQKYDSIIAKIFKATNYRVQVLFNAYLKNIITSS